MIDFDNCGRMITSPSDLPPIPQRIGSLFGDFETTSKDSKLDALNVWRNCWAAGFAFTWDDVPGAWYLPICHRDKRFDIDRDIVIKYLTDLFAATTEWVNHNVKYDAHVLMNDLGVDCLSCERIVCTVVRSKILDSDRQYRGGYGLDALSLGLLKHDIGRYEHALRVQLGDSKDYGVVPPDIMGEYACQDVMTNRNLHKYIVANMPAESSPVVETETALTSELIRMERRGMLVRPLEVKITRLKVLTEMVALEQRLHEAVGYPFLPGSNKDCHDVLCNHYGLPILAYTERDDGTRGNPSFDQDTLELYLNRVDAPVAVVSDILEYRRRATFKSLFLETFEDLAIDCGNGYAVMHPDHNQCVRTGRMSVRRPNTQQQDERSKRLFLPGDGMSFMSCDACLPAGTLVPTPYGDKPIEIVAYNLLPVLTLTDDGHLEFAEVSRGARVGFGPIMRITFDDGSTFECTPEHGFMTYEGDRINCQDLLAGTRLKHVEDTPCNVWGPGVYPAWRVNGKWFSKHRTAAQWAYGEEPIDPMVNHVHHIDEDKTNWCVTNLEVKNKFEHWSDHAKANYHKQDHTARVEALRLALASRRTYHGDGNPNWQGGKVLVKCECCNVMIERWPSQDINYCSDECRSKGRSLSLEMSWAARGAFKPHVSKCELCNTDYHKTRKRDRFCSRSCAHKFSHAKRRADKNYRVVSIEVVRSDWFYSITVPKTGMYVTANGLVNANSQIEFRTIAHYTQDHEVIAAYNNNPDIDYHQRVADMCGIKRRPAKTVNFSVAFGQGRGATVELLTVDKDVVESIGEAIDELIRNGELLPDGRDAAFRAMSRQRGEALYEKYHATFPNIKRTSRDAERAARERGFVRNVRGRRRYLPDTHCHKAFNTLNQSSAADIIKERMTTLADHLRGTGIEMVTQVHDEVLMVGPTELLDDLRTQRDIVAILEDVHCLRVPIRFNYGVSSDNWMMAAKSVKDGGAGGKSIPLDEIKQATQLAHLKK